VTGHDYRSVAARSRQEVPELERVAQRASRAWASASRDPDDLFVDAAALNIHGFYVGLEHIFTLVAQRIDASLPGGPNWHQDLLRQMTAEMPGGRARGDRRSRRRLSAGAGPQRAWRRESRGDRRLAAGRHAAKR